MIYEIPLRLMLSTSVERFGAAGIQFWLAGNFLEARIIFHFQEGEVVPNRQKSFDNLRKNWMYKKCEACILLEQSIFEMAISALCKMVLFSLLFRESSSEQTGELNITNNPFKLRKHNWIYLLTECFFLKTKTKTMSLLSCRTEADIFTFFSSTNSISSFLFLIIVFAEQTYFMHAFNDKRRASKRKKNMEREEEKNMRREGQKTWDEKRKKIKIKKL